MNKERKRRKKKQNEQQSLILVSLWSSSLSVEFSRDEFHLEYHKIWWTHIWMDWSNASDKMNIDFILILGHMPSIDRSIDHFSFYDYLTMICRSQTNSCPFFMFTKTLTLLHLQVKQTNDLTSRTELINWSDRFVMSTKHERKVSWTMTSELTLISNDFSLWVIMDRKWQISGTKIKRFKTKSPAVRHDENDDHHHHHQQTYVNDLVNVRSVWMKIKLSSMMLNMIDKEENKMPKKRSTHFSHPQLNKHVLIM